MNGEQFWKHLEPEHAAAEAFCRRLEGERDHGDDLYQEAVLKAFQNRASLRDTTAFRPWFYRIIVNLYKNRRRRPWWRRFVPLTPELEEHASGRDPSGRHEATRWLERAFAAVTPAERTLVTLFELEGWSVAELATLLQKPEGTIKARLSRARARMRKAISHYLAKSEREVTINQQLDEATICVVTKPEPE